MEVHDTPILEVISGTLSENPSVVTNDTHGPRKCPHHEKQLEGHISMGEMALTWHIYLMMDKPLGRYFQVQSPYYHVAQCNQETPIPVS